MFETVKEKRGNNLISVYINMYFTPFGYIIKSITFVF